MENIFDFGSTVFDDGFILFLVRAGLILLFCKILTKIIHRSLNRTAETLTAEKVNATSMGYLEQILKFILYVVALVTILNSVKPLKGAGTALLGATGVITVFVGLAAQETFGNFIAGLTLAIIQPIHVGDVIYIPEKNVTGVVKQITFRHTVLTSWDNHAELLIPNNMMNTVIVQNYAGDGSYYNTILKVGVAYDTDIDLARRIIQERAASVKGVVDPRGEKEKKAGVPMIPVRLTDFGDSALMLSFRVSSENLAESYDVCSRVREEVLKGFRENNISIPYTTITIDH